MFTLRYNPIRKELNASDIKLVAIITMLIDHIGAFIIESLMQMVDYESSTYTVLDLTDQIMRSIGRLAFPIFAFFIAVGFTHTRNKWKYFSRLLLFGLISEIPFDLANNSKLFYLGYQNVYFTLAFGLLAIIGRDYLKKINFNEKLALVLRYISFFLFGVMAFFLFGYSYTIVYIFKNKVSLLFEPVRIFGKICSLPSNSFFLFSFIFGLISLVLFSIFTIKKDKDKVNREAISWFIPYLCMILAQIAKTDYAAKGVLVVIVAYAFIEMTTYNNDAIVYSVVAISIFSLGELTALLDVFLMDRYNGQKGNMNKYVFYLFYPVHLLILGLISTIFLIP